MITKQEIIALINDPKNKLEMSAFKPNFKQYRLTTADAVYTMTMDLKNADKFSVADANGELDDMSAADKGEIFNAARNECGERVRREKRAQTNKYVKEIFNPNLHEIWEK
ncbi:MAG: hypothetical protein J6T57_03705 [Alphaproteobacteria bacterium]|nr:hypothetical protein [Alphaproteobacteria bacterium]